jgi:hypothetical protein
LHINFSYLGYSFLFNVVYFREHSSSPEAYVALKEASRELKNPLALSVYHTEKLFFYLTRFCSIISIQHYDINSIQRNYLFIITNFSLLLSPRNYKIQDDMINYLQIERILSYDHFYTLFSDNMISLFKPVDQKNLNFRDIYNGKWVNVSENYFAASDKQLRRNIFAN